MRCFRAVSRVIAPVIIGVVMLLVVPTVGGGAALGANVPPSPMVTEGESANVLVNAAHNLCLDANESTDNQNGGAVTLWQCNFSSGVNQYWFWSGSTEELVNAAASNENMCLDAKQVDRRSRRRDGDHVGVQRRGESTVGPHL